MSGHSLAPRTAQLDKAEREHLEAVVAEMRDRVEDNVRFQLTQQGLETEPKDRASLDGSAKQLAEAIELEAADGHDWAVAFEAYVDGVGYTIVNRLAALRCMEVRDFLDEEVTVVKPNGLTPAAETLVHEEFLLEDEALVEAYHRACDDLAAEIEILFDRSTAYGQLDPDDDTFEDLCRILDGIPDEVWRADDVLGWVYEYYNRPVVEALDAKNTLEPADIGPANQFYTPHWVVRMLADNALGKLYLEATGQESTVPDPGALSIEERKQRPVTPEAAPTVSELCTYLIPDDKAGEAPDFEDPSEIRVIDPACGSGHFLLYAFDILERIWWAETDLDRREIPAKILEHNLYGIDIDLRSCQLAAFNLYLKARTRTEEANGGDFEMPNVGIVCADARVAEVEEAVEVLDEITEERTEVRKALAGIIDEFQTTEALGSLLDVQGTLSEELMEEQTDIVEWGEEGPHTLNEFLSQLEDTVDERTSDSFGEQNLRSFLNLLVVLTQNYDVALMNPPYGSGGRMPDDVQDYVEENYTYTSEYYINFFEVCDRLSKKNGRIGMLVPWSFMFRKWFQPFREDFIGEMGAFDFFAEFGYDVLDNATVGTVGTVIRSGVAAASDGTFIRLSDVAKQDMEQRFIEASFEGAVVDGVRRRYTRSVEKFDEIPGTPLSYWVPDELRELFASDVVIDAGNAKLDRQSAGHMSQGLATADDDRFVRYFWETDSYERWAPFAKGGADAEYLPQLKHTVRWGGDQNEVKRYVKSYPRNVDDYGSECLTYTVFKRGGRRFGYLCEDAVFSHVGSVIVPDRDIWTMLAYANSHVFNYLMIAQTQERNWDVGLVSRMPWPSELETTALSKLTQRAVGYMLLKRQRDVTSPHYDGPLLLDVLAIEDPLAQYEHPHRKLRHQLPLDEPDHTVTPSDSLTEAGIAAARYRDDIERKLQSCIEAIDEAVFDCFDITDDQRETVLQEIALRTIEDPRERREHDAGAITEPPGDFPALVKDLLLHLTLRIVTEDSDGIVPISTVEGKADLLTRIEGEFERLFGEYAATRLAEVDQVLGNQTADKEAYPNLRAWIEDDLFSYHVSKFDRTPVLWRLTTERLVSDPEGEGFACLLDYHQLDSGLFDRLQNRYLEPRKTLLRERRSASNRRRGDDVLSPTEKATAAAEYGRCASGLEQIEVFEERVAELAQPDPREWPEENRAIARDMAATVPEFRAATADRLETLDELAALDGTDMGELFSPSFYETVQQNREEWLDALGDLEMAFEAYARDGSEPVEAHLYDLFEYYDDLVGSSHYASNGILFMAYYFDKFEDTEQAQIGDGDASKRQRLCSELASDIEAYKALGNDISDACDALVSDIPSEWGDRARSEITTTGYQPNRKHGVEINITPLAEYELVPKIVDDTVL
ncbi:MAG: BREX-5 system adenine-specific DNA-methyltransferase PglX [Natronomonas sp.]